MAVTLNIDFTGLCMFVPKTPDRMYVLLPSPEAEHGMHRHTAALAFDSANLRSGAEAQDESTVLTALAGFQLDIPGANPILTVCGEIPNLRDITGRSVNPELLMQTVEDRNLRARVNIRGGEMVGVKTGACWEWLNGTYRLIAFKVRWKVEYPDPATSVTLTLTPLGTGGDEREIVLYPVQPPQGQQQPISINILHVTPEDLPPDAETEFQTPEFGFQPEHFRAFYKLFGQAVPVLLPKFWGDAGFCTNRDCDDFEVDKGGSPFNCIVASDH